MLIPIRCFTCGSVISAKWDEYKRRTDEGERSKQVLDDLKVTRYCCRQMLISSVDLTSDIATFGNE